MLQVALAVAFVVFLSYAAGRVHQWYRHSLEREDAYRDGYDEASHSLFRLATRTAAVGETSRRIIRGITGGRDDSVQDAVSKANREASTYRLMPHQTPVSRESTPQAVDATSLR